MQKPKVFIGSSSEGLKIAEAVFAGLQHDAAPTLWTNQLFLPGQYPLEALEQQLRRNSFAVLVASPDDTVIKRDVLSPAMRDNLLLEFGLFAGALGRRRVFFVCPDLPRVDLPSDLFGVITATYDAARARGDSSERAAAVQAACQQIIEVVGQEWAAMQQAAELAGRRIRASDESQAIERLYFVGIRLRDALMAVQREAFAAFSDETVFNQVKQHAATETQKIADSFIADAQRIGVEQELRGLSTATVEALLALPFPRELAVGPDVGRQQAVDIGLGALNDFLGGRDPMRGVQRAASREASARVLSLSDRYSQWWAQYSPRLQDATAQLQDRLFQAMLRVSAQKLSPD
jgi:hypothetical protein